MAARMRVGSESPTAESFVRRLALPGGG
jgi:hypothetical protein